MPEPDAHYVAQLREALAQSERPARKSKAVWQPLTLADLVEGSVIAVDQSLGACGLVLLCHEGGALWVRDAVTFKTAQMHDNAREDAFLRGVDIARQIRSYLAKSDVGVNWVCVHEAPPSGGGTMRNPDSSILGGLALRIEVGYRQIPMAPMVSVQQHKWATAGNRLASKGEHRAALVKLAGTLPIGDFAKVTNESHRDALSVGITHLAREAEK